MNDEIFFDEVKTSLGLMAIVFDEGNNIVASFLPLERKKSFCYEIQSLMKKKGLSHSLTKKHFHERGAISDYFSGKGTDLSDLEIDMDFLGITSFQKKVYSLCREIPKGQTRSYSYIARQIGGSSPRAVGTALGKNHIPLFIPCHRVISKRGMGGFSAGYDDTKKNISLKRKLLSLETPKNI